jgi:hypothetical protein
MEKNMVYRQGVEDRKAEKERKKRVRDLAQEGQEGQDVPPELLIPILDKEKQWKETRQIQAQLA